MLLLSGALSLSAQRRRKKEVKWETGRYWVTEGEAHLSNVPPNTSPRSITERNKTRFHPLSQSSSLLALFDPPIRNEFVGVWAPDFFRVVQAVSGDGEHGARWERDAFECCGVHCFARETEGGSTVDAEDFADNAGETDRMLEGRPWSWSGV